MAKGDLIWDEATNTYIPADEEAPLFPTPSDPLINHKQMNYGFPQIWWDPQNPDTAKLVNRDGTIDIIPNFPRPDSRWESREQGGPWEPLREVETPLVLDEFKRIQKEATINDAGYKFLVGTGTKGGVLRDRGLHDLVEMVGNKLNWKSLDGEFRKDIIFQLTLDILDEAGHTESEMFVWEPMPSGVVAGLLNNQKTMINKSPESPSPSSLDAQLEAFGNQLGANIQGSPEYTEALQGISDLQSAMRGSMPGGDQALTTSQYIAQQLALNTEEGNRNAQKVQSFLNQLTPGQIEHSRQFESNQLWQKSQAFLDRQISRKEFDRLVNNDIFNVTMAERGMTVSEGQLTLAKTAQKDLRDYRADTQKLEYDKLTLSDEQFQQTYGLSKNQFLSGEDQRSFENRFAQDQFNAQQEQLQFSNQQALTDQAFRATELGLDLLNSPGDLFTFLTRLRGEQGSLPFQQGGQAIPRTFPFTFNQAIPPQPFNLRDRDWAPQDYDWGKEGYQQPKMPRSPLDPPRYDPDTSELIADPFDMPDTAQPPTIPPSTIQPPLTASQDAVQQVFDEQREAEDPVTWDVAQQIADMEMPPPSPAPAPIGEVATTSMMAPTLGAGAPSPMSGTIAPAGMTMPTAQISPSQQLGFGGTGTRTVTPSGIPMTTLQPFGLPTSTVGPLPRQGLSQAFLGMPPTGRRTLASLGAPPALSAQSMTRLTPTERAIRLSEAKAQGFSEQDFLEEDRRHQMAPGTGGGRARFVPGRFRG